MLLLSVELLNRALKRQRAETANEPGNEFAETSETSGETGQPVRAVDVSQESDTPEPPTAAQKMWAYYQDECAKGRTPTGAELDRVAGTDNYCRRILDTGGMQFARRGERSRVRTPSLRKAPRSGSSRWRIVARVIISGDHRAEPLECLGDAGRCKSVRALFWSASAPPSLSCRCGGRWCRPRRLGVSEPLGHRYRTWSAGLLTGSSRPAARLAYRGDVIHAGPFEQFRSQLHIQPCAPRSWGSFLGGETTALACWPRRNDL